MPYFFFSSRRRHTRYIGDWSSDVCSSDLFSFLAGFLSRQKSYAMKQQPFSIYCEKFRLSPPSNSMTWNPLGGNGADQDVGFRVSCDQFRVDANRGDHFLPAGFPLSIVAQ